MKLVKIGGTDILVSPIVIVLAAMVVFFGYATRLIVVAMVVLLHEAAHAFAAVFLGYNLEEVKLFPLGGAIRIGGMFQLDPGIEIIIALAGPVMNIFLVLFTFWFGIHGLVQDLAVDFFVAINVIMAIFNLLPALPMDGGRILRALLSYRWGIVKATHAVWVMGRLLAVLLVLLAAFSAAASPFVITMLAAAVFLFFAGEYERKMAAPIVLGQVERKKSLLKNRGPLKSKTMAAAYNTHCKKIISRFVPGYYHIVYVIGEDGQVLGRVGEQEILNGMMRYGYNVRLQKIIGIR